jgi:hypothetical protein
MVHGASDDDNVKETGLGERRTSEIRRSTLAEYRRPEGGFFAGATIVGAM